MRLSYEEIDKLRESLGTDRLYSWSRINCVHNSLYEYYLKYILHKPEDRDDSIYKVTGGIAHTILEDFYGKKIGYDDMIDEFEEGWTLAFDVAELKFNRKDGNRNQTIADKYYFDLQSFFKTHEVIHDDMKIEEFITVKIGDQYYQGYIDCLIKDESGNYTILDWKTSSIYKGEKARNECGQLVMYAMALHQQGIPYNQIRIGWNFLKYMCVTVQSKNGTKKVREIERYELGDKLQANAKMWLKEFGYTDNLTEYLDRLSQTNDINVLPEEVRAKYELHDCYVYVPITEELLEQWTTYIIDTEKRIRQLEVEYEALRAVGSFEEADKVWWEDEESIKKQSYYLLNLSGYSPKLHKPYKAYLDKLNNNTDDDLLKKNNEKEEIDNMDWLNDL